MRRLGILVVVLLAAAATSSAQQKDTPPLPKVQPKAQPQPKVQPQPKAQPQPEAQPQLAVSVEQALYLIRSTLLTLNDANRTGNYTVLRDLAAPDFQAKNSAAELAQIFSDLRRRNFDLFAVALAAPQLVSAPALDDNKMLRLTGFFPTRPMQINFDLLFQNVGGQWRLFGIAVSTPQVQPQATEPEQKGKAPAGKSN
jgi:hypothetical protein